MRNQNQIKTTLQSFFQNHKKALGFILEIAIIAVWALWIGKPYLDMDPSVWPVGNEYAKAQENNYNWEMIPVCGSCFLWNGFANGGAPSFVDTLGSWLHPISIFTTLIWGAFNSGKITFILSIFMAGMAQWWLGKILKVGPVARVWGALLVVSGGHLAGSMELGVVPLVTSKAAASLVIPAGFQFAIHSSRKNAILLGITLGLAALAGQGYLQIGLLITVFPAFFYILISRNGKSTKPQQHWKEFAIACLTAFLIAAVLLVPFLSHFSVVEKYRETEYTAGQPLQYVMLNLVIADEDYLRSPALGNKAAYPYLHSNFIGWIPLGFALIALVLSKKEHRSFLLCAAITLPIIFVFSSTPTWQWMIKIPIESISTLISSIRYPSVIQSLAIPFITALAMIGLDTLQSKSWAKLKLSLAQTNNAILNLTLPIKWIFLTALIFFSLRSTAAFTRLWTTTKQMDLAEIEELTQELITPNAQWVQTVYGENFWVPSAMHHQLKIRDFVRAWWLKGDPLPEAYLEFTRIADDADRPEYVKTTHGIVLLSRPENSYAYITDGETKIPCTAQALGGNIDVTCNSPIAGHLVVLERDDNGWQVKLDGEKQRLIKNTWLTTSAPQGQHTFEFRYRPWDVPVGAVLSAAGWVLAISGLISEHRKKKTESVPETETPKTAEA